MERIAASPQLLWWVHDRLPRPVTRVRNHNAEAVDFAVLVFVGDGRESVPFKEGTSRDLQSVKRLHGHVLEVQSDGVVGENFGIDVTGAKTGPGEEGAAGGDAEAPEVGAADDVDPPRDAFDLGFNPGVEDVVRPEDDEGGPACETMAGFEVVVEHHTESRVGGGKDGAEEGYEDVRHDKVGEGVTVPNLDEIFGDEGRVEDEPNDSSCSATTVNATVVEDLRHSSTEPEREGVRDGDGDLVS